MFFPSQGDASLSKLFNIPEKISTKSKWKGCPSQTAGKLILELAKNFEKNKSLYKLSQKITEEKLDQKYFIKKYSIKYNQFRNEVSYYLECPSALVKVSAINNSGHVVSSSVLVDNGSLYDLTYETLLKSERILKEELPTLAISADVLNENYKSLVTNFFMNLDPLSKQLMSEMIIDEDGKMTIILSHQRRPSSVFLGKDNWKEKQIKLTRMVKYLTKKKGLPKIINMTNLKKVVVKF
tara:strand:- start:490 stop:1203 length:714 start_codon:yes stop_codon:yes gene_type:complete